MEYQTQTIRKTLSEIPTDYYLPPIQRAFVWDEKRIEKLFDSILRGYPISTFLFWTTKDSLKLRRFIDNYADDVNLDFFRVAPNDKKKTLILDGQQRLQSLFVGAEGTLRKGNVFRPSEWRRCQDLAVRQGAPIPGVRPTVLVKPGPSARNGLPRVVR